MRYTSFLPFCISYRELKKHPNGCFFILGKAFALCCHIGAKHFALPAKIARCVGGYPLFLLFATRFPDSFSLDLKLYRNLEHVHVHFFAWLSLLVVSMGAFVV